MLKKVKNLKSIPSCLRECVRDIESYLKDNAFYVYMAYSSIEIYSLWLEMNGEMNPSEVSEDYIELFVEWLDT